MRPAPLLDAALRRATLALAGCTTTGRSAIPAAPRPPRIGSNTAMKPVNPNGGLVYSTEAGRMCPVCRHPIAQCSCRKAAAAPAGDGVVRLFFETKGRGGKGVTVVRGLALDEAALTALGKKLKTACGVGGTAKDGVIELQGDHRDRVMALLKEQGRNVKKAGG